MTPCTAPLYRSGSRVQMRYDGALGRVTPEPPVFKPGLGWVYRVRLDASVFPIICTELALRWPELPALSGNVVALRAVQPELPGAA